MSMLIEDNDQTRARREHLERIRELVGNAYPNKFRRTNVAGSPEGEDTITALVNHETIKRIVNDESFAAAFDALMRKAAAGERPATEELAPVNEHLNAITVRASGRLAVPPRVMGKAAFVHLSDGSARLQIYVRRDDVREMTTATGATIDGWELFGLLDHGDFIGVEGYLFVTKTGELSIHVRTFEFLTKALLPMPDKLHGISDPEIRQRQRYADLIAGSLKVKTDDDAESDELTPREVFERRSRIISEMRRYLDDHGYIEVETPILSPLASGAAARPFKTHHNALDNRPLRAHRPRTLSQASARRRLRARLRTQPQLPQRRHRPHPQPRIHHARILLRLHGCQRHDGFLGTDAPHRRPKSNGRHNRPLRRR